MKKIMIMFFSLGLFILHLSFSLAEESADLNQNVSSQEETVIDAGRLAQDFTKAAMAEFKSVDDMQLSYAQISSKVEEYSEKFAQVLLGSGLDSKTAAMIMQNASALYGQTLEALFNGKNYDMAIQEYSGKISDLFRQQNLEVAVQSKIVAMTSDNLESINNFFQDIEGNTPQK